eukprot:14500534-Alexandrium_andersonii.AAC.1
MMGLPPLHAAASAAAASGAPRPWHAAAFRCGGRRCQVPPPPLGGWGGAAGCSPPLGVPCGCGLPPFPASPGAAVGVWERLRGGWVDFRGVPHAVVVDPGGARPSSLPEGGRSA